MSNKKQYLNLLSLYYVEGMRNILISSINSLFVVFFLYFTGLHGFSLFIPFIVGSWTVFYIICSYKSGQVSVVDNYFYFQGDLTELFILLNKCGFSLVSELSGYYTLTATNIVGIIGQICLKSEQEKVIIFGNTKLIKMLTHDLPKLQAMYNEQ